MIEYNEFKKALPHEKRNLLTEEVFKTIQRLDDDPELDLRDELITYTNVLQTGKFKITDYAKACKYIALKSSGMSNKDAYSKVFPERIDKWLREGKPWDKIHRYINKYNTSTLVTKITERALIPTKILNQDKVQQSLNVLSDLMLNAKSEMVKMKAAETILRELKIEEDNKIELDINIKKDESLDKLEKTLMEFSGKQLEAIQNKQIDPKQIAEMDIIDTVVENG